jgi:hypothetical protein
MLWYYMAIGFGDTGEKFLRRENGHPYPMKINLEKSMSRVGRFLFTVS